MLTDATTAPALAAPRHNNFDALRLVAAASVIFSHAFLIAEGNDNHEPMVMLSGRQFILGHVGVFVFFIISGFLIAQSFEATGAPLRFLAKRALRIFPGLAFSLLLCALVLGPIVTDLPLGEYLRSPRLYAFLGHNLVLDEHVNGLPGVSFVDNPTGGTVNGSLWTLKFEVLMYLMVLALGMMGLLVLPVSLALLALGMACIVWMPLRELLGGSTWLLGFFAAGMCLYQLRGRPILDGRLALIAAAGLVLSIPLKAFIPLFPLLGGYLTIYIAFDRRLPVVRATRFGDLSYGLYIYGWPVEEAVMYATGGRAAWWQVLALALSGSALLAWISWHLVEARALRLKPKGALAAARERRSLPIAG